tara:strand:+ start:3419 stop:3922 length:504 start_codon:yes stop_codon:yes gene_type:complete
VNEHALWAPWRLDYIKTTDREEGCFLCRYRDEGPEADNENLVIGRSAHSISLLNRYPYNNGHLLVAPLEHGGELEELGDEALMDCIVQIKHWTKRLREGMSPDGFNIGLNVGRVAGAGLPGHLHWHIVPRWNGDTNFMPVVGNASVIPQSLKSLYDLLVLPESERQD